VTTTAREGPGGAPAGRERLGTGKLRLPDVVAQSVGFMGPVFSSAFVIPLVIGIGSATGQGGGLASPLSVIIAAVGIFGLGWVVSSYARRIHAAGSLYDYVTDGLGERVGAVAGWLYYGGVMVLGASLTLLIGGFVQSTIRSELGSATIPDWAWTLVIVGGLSVLAYLGVQVSTRFQLTMALVSLSVLTVFFAYVVVHLGGANSARAFEPSSAADGWKGIFLGVLYGVLLFVGFETSANLAEETPNPSRHIPFAVMFTAGLALVYFVLATYAQIAGFHFDLKALAASASGPVFVLGSPAAEGGYGAIWLRRLLELVVALDMLAVAMGIFVSASRGLFGMARQRHLPAVLARVDRRRGTPVIAIGALSALCGVFVVLDQAFPGLYALPRTPHYFAMFAWGATFGAFSMVIVYLLMCVGALRRPRTGGAVLSVASVVGLLISAGALFGSVYEVTAPTIWAPWLSLIWLGVGVVVTTLAIGRRPVGREPARTAPRPPPTGAAPEG
jgi:amino acid transporter